MVADGLRMSLWDELDRVINDIDPPSHNLHELRQDLSEQWANIPVEGQQCLVASMPRRLAAIIRVMGGNTRD